MFKPHGITRFAATALAAMAIAGVLSARTAAAQDAPKPAEKTYEERRAADGPWAKGASWLSFGAGYARAGGKNAGDGLGGYGIGFQRMLNDQWGFGVAIRHELLGHLGKSYEISVPFTAEFVRHIAWKTAVRPYVGFGGGYYFQKYYRTGADYTGAPGAGWHLSTGVNLPLDDRHVLGLDARVGFVGARGGSVVNPVFGPEPDSQSQWSVKLNWALVP